GGSARWIVGGQASSAIPAGQAWLVDGWRGYEHENPGSDPLVYLVVDTVGSAAFWSTVNSADRPLDPEREGRMSPRRIRLSGAPKAIETEVVRSSRVMSPWELESLVNGLMQELRSAAPAGAPHLPKLESALSQFMRQWQAIHARHGENEAGDSAYRQALEQLVAQAALFAGLWQLPNGLDAAELLYQSVVLGALRDRDHKPVVILPPGARERQAKVARQRRLKEQARVYGQSSDAQPQSPRAHWVAEAPPADSAQAISETPASSQDAQGTAPAAPRQPTAKNPSPAQDPAQSPLRSVHTKSLPDLLRQAASSVLVTTYQAGKLVILREDDGKLNTHFRVYNRPMGLAADTSRMALGTALTVEYYRNMPQVAAKLEPPNKHDAAFLPRHGQITGNIDIHEMAWAGEELWLVNTRFSCLCTLDQDYSFVPRWRPSFISGYAADDRCHLNGLEVVDGRPKYVTALGTSDRAGGWRENKAGGGVLIDVDSGDFVCRGLSMPHSPRWYQDRLWVLESGNGTLATVDPRTGQLDTVAELPGFTRGLDFLGPYAFVGLSQVRESAVFSGISLTERVSERNCGVWVVDIRSGQVVAFLKFEDAVQEVFAVSVLAGIRYPDVLAASDARVGLSYALPDEALKEVVAVQA
ncbi:MAG: TIGR03032 family protein, partial [Wenzhouxiangella sp.]|nr:TIGR03032 family protein [Wenzhouxiangella sp.]